MQLSQNFHKSGTQTFVFFNILYIWFRKKFAKINLPAWQFYLADYSSLDHWALGYVNLIYTCVKICLQWYFLFQEDSCDPTFTFLLHFDNKTGRNWRNGMTSWNPLNRFKCLFFFHTTKHNIFPLNWTQPHQTTLVECYITMPNRKMALIYNSTNWCLYKMADTLLIGGLNRI